MSRRKTVKLNLEFVNPRIKEVCHNNVIFCNQMGRPNQKTWVTDWNRVKDGNWAPKNLPSPEEAARMCILLETTPEEILLHEGETDEETAKCLEDIQRVKELVEELTAESEEKRSAKGEALSPVEQEIFDFISAASVEEIAEVLRFIGYLKSKREQAHGPSETLQSSHPEE